MVGSKLCSNRFGLLRLGQWTAWWMLQKVMRQTASPEARCAAERVRYHSQGICFKVCVEHCCSTAVADPSPLIKLALMRLPSDLLSLGF